MKYLLIVLILLLPACNSTGALINQLSLDEGEHGIVCVRATVDTNSNPFITALATFVYKEYPEGDEPPEC